MIVCRSRAELEKLRRVNQVVGTVLAELRAMVAPGVTTEDIDRVAEDLVRQAGAEPAFKGYHGYPATVCASINEQVVHGIPSARELVDGDILSLDMGAKLDGFFGARLLPCVFMNVFGGVLSTFFVPLIVVVST